MIARLSRLGFVAGADVNGNVSLARSWIAPSGRVESVEIIRTEPEFVVALRENGDGELLWGPHRGRPERTSSALIAGTESHRMRARGVTVMRGGWTWGRIVQRTQPGSGSRSLPDPGRVVHATFAFGLMPRLATSFCANLMDCHGHNPPLDDPILLCPECCTAIVAKQLSQFRARPEPPRYPPGLNPASRSYAATTSRPSEKPAFRTDR